MKQCVKITLSIKNPGEILQKLVHPKAEKLSIEGVGYAQDGLVKIVAAGTSDAINSFIDALYRGHKTIRPSIVEVEPHLKDRDYRGVFRIIEAINQHKE